MPLRDRVADWLEVDRQHLVQVLVAEYAPGTPLGWHRDVPDFEAVAGVSRGNEAVLRARPYLRRRSVRERISGLPREIAQ